MHLFPGVTCGLAALACCAAGVAAELPLYRNGEVVVTASRFPDFDLDKPVNVTVISAEDIRNSTARTIPELLGVQAGIGVRDLFGNNAASTSVDLRGFGAAATQNTLILLDGRRITDIDLSGVQWSSIPLAAIERIEIVRGGGAVVYGDGAGGGVINIITRAPSAAAPRATAAARAGSYDTYEGQVTANLAGTGGGVNLAASRHVSDGYRSNNNNRQSNLYADARWNLAGGELAFKLLGTEQSLRLPGARRVQPSAGVNQLETDRRGTSTPLDYSTRDGYQAMLDWRQATGWGEFIVAGGYRDKVQKSYFDFSGFPDYRETDLGVWSFNPRARIEHSAFGLPGSLVAGFDHYRWDYRLRVSNAPGNIGRPINDVSATQRNSAVYLLQTSRLGTGTTVVAGARGEWFSLSASDVFDPTAPGGAFGSGAMPASQSRFVPAYELGLRHPLTPAAALVGKLGRSFRFANVDETYETSTLFTREFQILKPQINTFGEIGIELRRGVSRLRATAFQIDVDDEIHLDVYTTGIGNTNLPPSRRRGLEVEGGTSLDALSLAAAYTYVDARFREGVLPGGAFTARNVVIAGKRVPLVPQHRANLSATWRLAPQTRLSGRITYVGTQYMDNDEGNTFYTRIPGYPLADVKLAHEIGQWRITAALNNLFDTKYYAYGVRSQFVADRYNAYPLPTRNATVTLEYVLR